MATNTTNSFTNHTGNNTAGPFSISFDYLAESEVVVTVGGVTKDLTTHYTFPSATTISFTSGNHPANSAVIKFQRNTNVSSKKVDFQDGSVLTEADLDSNTNQLLYGFQEFLDDGPITEADLLDEDNMASNSATKAATQQSIKAYVDANTGTTNLSYTAGTRELASSTGTNVNLPEATTSNAGLQSSSDKTKLDGIETSATADQTAAEIRTLVESATDSNVFTDADHTKLNAIEASATADQTNAEIRAAVEAASDSNVFTDADHTKLNAIETSATADQTGAEIKTAYEAESNTNAYTDAEKTKLSGIATSANNYSISSDLLDEDNMATNSATKVPSQQSVKAYVDANGGGGGTTNLSATANGTSLTVESSSGNNVSLPAATTSAWGVMSDDDKTKLDGIETSATADQTNAEIRAAVEAATDSNVFTDADHTKLNSVASNANVGITDVVGDTSPQLGGDLDVQAREITTSTTNGDIVLNPNGEFGVVKIKGDSTNNIDGTLELACSAGSHGVKIKSPPHSAAQNYTLTLPSSIVNGAFLKTDSNGGLSFATPTDTNTQLSNAEVRTAVEAASDSNVFTDADHTKLNAIEASADVTDATNVNAAGAIMNSDLDGKGELLVGDGSGDPSALAVGTNGYILKADSSTATGLAWAAAGAGGDVNQNAFSNFAVSGQTTVAADSTTDTVTLVGGTNVTITTNATNDEITFTSTDTNTTYSVGDGGLTQNNFTNTLKTKLDGIEASATADQTNAEIRAAVEAASDSNVFTDADHTKLNAIAASANNYVHPNHSGDVTSSADGATTIANDAVTGAKIADDAIDSEHYTDGSIDTAHIANDAVTADKLANSINTEIAANTAKTTNATHTGEVTGSGALTITADAVTGAKIADDAIDSEHYTDGSIDTAHIADDQVTLAKMAGLARGKIIYGDASGDPAALAPGSANQVLTSDGTDISWAAGGGGGGGDLVYISTQTVSSATAQVEYDFSSTDYDFFIIKAYGCKFTAAPSNGYCVYFVFYDGAYDSSNVATNRLSLKYQRNRNDGSTLATSSAWSYHTTLFLDWTPTTSTNFSFNAEIGSKTNSPVYITSNFLDGTSTSSGSPSITGIAPNPSNNMTHLVVKPSSTTFAAGTFLLYGVKNS